MLSNFVKIITSFGGKIKLASEKSPSICSFAIYLGVILEELRYSLELLHSAFLWQMLAKQMKQQATNFLEGGTFFYTRKKKTKHIKYI